MYKVMYVLPQDTENVLFENTAPLADVEAVVVAQDAGSGALGQQMEKFGVPVYDLGAGTLALQSRQLRQRISKERPDIVEFHGFRPSLLAGAARWVVGSTRRVIVVRHHNLSHHLRGRRRAVAADKVVAAMSHAIVAVSEAVRDTLIAEGTRRDKIRVIPNSAPIIREDQFKRSDGDGTSGNVARLLAVGRLEWDKDYEGLLRALGQVGSRGFDVELTVAGTGDVQHAQHLRSTAAAVAAGIPVHWMGWRPDVGQLMLNADLLVHNSRDESFGLAVLEAIRHRLPVVSTFVGGLREVAGPYFPQCAPNEPIEFSRLLVEAIVNLPRWRERATLAELEMRSRFTPAAVKEMRLNFYQELLAGPLK